VRAYNSLRRVGIHTVDDLSARTEAELLAIENLGPQSVREIRERLAGIGRHLAEPGSDGAPAAPDAATAASAAAGSGAAAGARSPATTGGQTGQDGPTAGATPGGPASGPVAAPRAPRPPDEDAIDLLSVAGFPVLKRALPVLGAAVVLLLVVLGLRGKRRG
jgi:hypothetical protein